MVRSIVALFVVLFAIPGLRADDSPNDTEKKPEFYTPKEITVEGWTVRLDPALYEPANEKTRTLALRALANHLQRVEFIVPEERVRELKTLPIWMDLKHPKLGSMQYHPGAAWLKSNGHDPKLVGHVHIPQAKQLFDSRTWAKHPYVILHELAHAYHDQFLGFDHKGVKETYDAAKEEKIYEKVLLYTGRTVRHYGLTNHKEYFAESTEAYFGVNDFYPFVRAELSKHDPRMFELLQKIWGPVR